MKKHFNLIGVGVGPFHLSLAALMSKVPQTNALFLDQKSAFNWHSELMFSDADMQTSFLKDLVTPVDPTSPYSFLNYLVEHGLFYSFMNTNRRVVTRREFEMYCQWVSEKLGPSLKFNSAIESVDYDSQKFIIKTKDETYSSDNLSIATGLTPRIPECAKDFISENVFHAKSSSLQSLNLQNKRVLIVGGGQTGVEIFRNALLGKWGAVKNIRLVSRRQNLEPLDESPFTNEYFTPSYVADFFTLEQEHKDPIVKSQKLASDGNTPHYLERLYNDLYHLKHVGKSDLDFKILPQRSLIKLEKTATSMKATIQNNFLRSNEVIEADIIILSTGFIISTPKILDPIKHLLSFDSEGRFIINRNFDLEWKGSAKNKIYALNFSRHRHGIAEPQTSLMAWRSATIINDMTGKEIYKNNHVAPSFVHYGKID
jgi:lysine N6-hydroxylase